MKESKRAPALAAVGLVIAGAVATLAASHDTPAATHEIMRLEMARQDAFVRGDVDSLDRATADDYTTINASGKISTKPQMMQNLRAAKTKVLSVKLDKLKARIYGDTAVLTGEYRDVNISGGTRRETHVLFTRVFVRNQGQWQAVAYQQTSATD